MPSGHFYALADFADRLMPKTPDGSALFVKGVLGGVKRLAIVQEENAWVTVHATVTAGIWVSYRGHRRWLINPAQSHLRLEEAYGQPSVEPDIYMHLRPGVVDGRITETAKPEFKQWLVTPEALDLVWTFFEALERPADNDVLLTTGDLAHPRYFPAEVRMLALDAFEREGRWCRGAEGRSKGHRLPAGAQLEFDHILPHSKGGASTERNVQVLCTACNRLKGATAA